MPRHHHIFLKSIPLTPKIIIFQIGCRVCSLQRLQFLCGNPPVDKQISARRQNGGPASEKFQFVMKLHQHTAAVLRRHFSRHLAGGNSHIRQHLMKQAAAPDPLCPTQESHPIRHALRRIVLHLEKPPQIHISHGHIYRLPLGQVHHILQHPKAFRAFLNQIPQQNQQVVPSVIHLP